MVISMRRNSVGRAFSASGDVWWLIESLFFYVSVLLGVVAGRVSDLRVVFRLPSSRTVKTSGLRVFGLLCGRDRDLASPFLPWDKTPLCRL